MPGKRGGVTLKELQAKAKAAKVKGWSKMNKAELMQRVGGGGGGGAPQRKKGVPVTTAKRYEAKGVAGKIVSKIGANLTDSGKKNLEAVLMKRVKSATDKARRQPGATDQSVRKAAAGAVKDVVRDVRSQSNSKRTRAGNPTRQQQALEKRLFQERDQNADATLARQRARERAYMERSFAEEEGVVPKRQRKSKKSSAKPVAAPNDEAKRRAEIEAKNRARTEALRAKHQGKAGLGAIAYAAKQEEGSDKEKQAWAIYERATTVADKDMPRRVRVDDYRTLQKALSRRARKTGKAITTSQPTGYEEERTFTGDPSKGGLGKRLGRRIQKAKDEGAKAYAERQAGASSTTSTTTPSPNPKTTTKKKASGTPQKQKRSRSTATTSRKKK